MKIRHRKLPLESASLLVGDVIRHSKEIQSRATENVAGLVSSFHELLSSVAGQKFSVTEHEHAFQLASAIHGTALKLGRSITLDGVPVFLEIRQSDIRQRLVKIAARNCQSIEERVAVSTSVPSLETSPMDLMSLDPRFIPELHRLSSVELLRQELDKHKNELADNPKQVRDRLKQLRKDANVMLVMLSEDSTESEKATVCVTGKSFQIRRSLDNRSLFSGRKLPTKLAILDNN